MGRRKIEIKAIKDDRNRSVTFLKRKGGLFKKAHELSVLCSVDVAVIIFGNNKKLYEYSSSDIGELIQRHGFYGGANEHKGPSDFNGKGEGDDDDEDGSVPEEGQPQEQAQMIPPQFANQAAFQHMRHAPSASPPIPNGAQFQHVQRQLTPQPQYIGSRPNSRNAPRMINSNLAPGGQMQQPQPSPPVNGYQYMQGAQVYGPPHGPGMPPHSQAPHMQHSLHPTAPMNQPLSHVFLEEQRRSSMPPAFPQHERHNSGSVNTPPLSHHQLPSQAHQQAQQQQQQQQQQAQMHQQLQQQVIDQQRQAHQQEQQRQREQQQAQQQAQHQAQMSQPQQPPAQTQVAPPAQMLEPVKRMSVKSRSIFTPIDESRSILSQHWASSTSHVETTRAEPQRSVSASSIASAAEKSTPATTNNSQMKSPPIPTQNRNFSASSSAGLPSSIAGPSRTNSMGLGGAGGAKRPKLKVHIPDEASDADGNSSNSGGQAGVTTDVTTSQAPRQGGVVLPPPSPSTNSILSAGASGPPNPFARPLPPQSNPSRESLGSRDSNQGRDRDMERLETPVSALPSRFTNDFLPSPSSFYPEWNFRSGDMNSPLNYSLATPVIGGPSFARDEKYGMDAKPIANTNGASNGTAVAGGAKRKSPDGDEESDSKRAKIET